MKYPGWPLGVSLVEVTEVACETCGDSGWVAVEGLTDQVRPCGCRRRTDVERLLDEARLPPRYEACTLETFQPSHDSTAGRDQLVGALATSRHYVDGFLEESGRFRDSGLLLTGPPGTGKTHLAVAVLRELIVRYGVRGLFVDLTSLTHELQSALSAESRVSTSSLLQPLEHAEVLVVDELGSLRLNAWTRDILYNLINGRYRRRLATIFTTNYALETPSRSAESVEWGVEAEKLDRLDLLEARIPKMLVSRLYEMTQPIPLDAVSDYRRFVRAPRHRA